MNKWIILVATIFVALAFSTTIGTTISNPSTSNVIISSGLVLLVVAGLWVFVKSDTKPKKDFDGFTPTD